MTRKCNGHGRNRKDMSGHERKWIEIKKGQPMTINKTTSKGLENSSYYHYPLTNHVFGLLSKNAIVSQERNIVFKFGFWEIFPFTRTWQEKMTRKWKDMKGKDMKAAEKTRIRQLSKWIERKGKATAIRKDYHPQAVRFYLLPLDYYRLLSGGKWNTRSDGTVILHIDR